MINRRFAVPAVCSLGLHAALLLGVGKSTLVMPTVATVFPAPYSPTVAPTEPEPIPPQIDPTDTPNNEPIPRIGEPRPVQTELIREPGPNVFVIPTQIEAANPIKGITHIGEIGVANGSITGSIEITSGGRILDARALDRPPTAKLRGSPSYPFDARRNGLTGEVLVDFIVGPAGEVREVSVVSSSDKVFEEPAVRAVSKWLFEPGRKDGRVVVFRMRQSITFNITND